MLLGMATVVSLGCGPDNPSRTLRESALPSFATQLKTSDDLLLQAEVFPAAEPLPPGLILVHMYGSSRHAWRPFAERAQQAGYAVVTFDLRGHGDSARLNPEAPRYGDFATSNWQDVALDIDAARDALVVAGADPANLGLAGASVGANLALAYAASHQDIQAVVLLSPGLEYKGIAVQPAFDVYGERPSMLVATNGDGYSARTCATLHASTNAFCELREFPGAEHGTDILDAYPNAAELIVLWLDTVLKNARVPAVPE